MSYKNRAKRKKFDPPGSLLSETPALGEPSFTETSSRSVFGQHAALVSVLIVLVFLAIVRLRLSDVPLERDEGEYAYAGQLILQGIPPYQLAYNMKFPGTYYAYSVILALFGQTPFGVHIGLIVVNTATIVIIFFLGRRLLNNDWAAAVAAIAFGIFSIDRWIMGVFAHATHFVVLAAMAGLLVLLHALESKKTIALVAAGALLGLSVLMKQNGIFFFALGIAAAAWSALENVPRDPQSAISRSLLVAAGGAIPFALLCVIFLGQGVLGKFWFWAFQYAKEYVSEVSVSNAWSSFINAVATITQADVLVWVLALVGVVLLWLVPWTRHTRITLTALLAASFIAIFPGFYFREHYFILLLPAAALFCGVTVLSAQRLLTAFVTPNASRIIVTGVFVLAISAFVVKESDYLFSMSTTQLIRERYGANPFLEAPEIASYIEKHSGPDDRVAVLGSEPEIYFYAKRHSATGYIYTYALMEQQPYSKRMQDEMISEVTSVHPKYVVFVRIPPSWLARNTQEKILTWSEKYLNQCYDLVGIADILSKTETKYVWDAEAAVYKPRSQAYIYTFKAKTDSGCTAPAA